MRVHSFSSAFRKALRGGVLISFCLAGAEAQTAKAQTDSGFSIETEMLTYRALESNSQALACDIAGFVLGAKPDFAHPSPGAGCSVAGAGGDHVVVLLPFEKTELDSFTAWKLAMIQMADYQTRAAALGCPKDPAARAGTNASTSVLSSFLSMSPAGPPLALAQSVLGLLASQEVRTSVGGTIGDLAFVDSVARQLKALQISVATPSSVALGSLSVADDKSSPFLASEHRLLLARGCLTTVKSANDQDAASVKQLSADIDSYLATLGGDKAKAAPAAAIPGVAAPVAGVPAAGATAAVPSKAADTTSQLGLLLHADALAKSLGYRFNAESGRLTAPPAGRYLLMVKALESGGSVTGRTNILGTKLRYSGGSVGTYALFDLDGGVACAGNVFDYAGSLAGKHFERDLAKVQLDPAKQVIFRSGGCSAAPAATPNVIH
jgi:hypothetical protein